MGEATNSRLASVTHHNHVNQCKIYVDENSLAHDLNFEPPSTFLVLAFSASAAPHPAGRPSRGPPMRTKVAKDYTQIHTKKKEKKGKYDQRALLVKGHK